jgi:hypothetical protein
MPDKPIKEKYSQGRMQPLKNVFITGRVRLDF